MKQYISKEKETEIQQLLDEWYGIRKNLEEYFMKRESKLANPVMQKAIEIFTDVLFALNDLEEKDLKRISECALKPVNVQERLEFIVKRPALYHSYVQLSELFSELEKIIAKQKASQNLHKKTP